MARKGIIVAFLALTLLNPAYGLSRNYICGTAAGSKPRLLIGKFLLFGDIEPPFSKGLGSTFGGALVVGLASSTDFAVFARGDETTAEARQFADAYNAIDNAFVGVPIQSDNEKIIGDEKKLI